ncbi:putative transposable element [Trichonephila clavipes]|uniref:Putative transposable element n=1 Tax=Trichonephila clavipes TaxID=2585209 RepID=A0A8X6RFQ8_TRICX|nr:putative transposable element [Trichonephila clavipes]
MITNFFIPELNNLDVQELWFQQDGAICHTARATIDLLKDTFGDRLISQFGPVNWPPRSCDLTPLDYFLWGYVKSLVYADKPQTLDHLEDNIRRVIAYIRPQMLEEVIENWTSRLDYIRASRGSPMPEIIFKIFEAWDTEDIIVDGKLLDVEVVGSGTERLVTVVKAVNIGHIEGKSVWLDEDNTTDLRRLLDVVGALTKLLDQVCNEYNSTPHSINKYPPAYLLFGLLPYQSPIDQNNYYEPVDEAREFALQRTID